MSIDVFIAYARNDRELLNGLGKHLSSLQRQGLINTWFDGDIVEGTEWRAQLLDHLRNAQVILLLISSDFISSKFCYDVEMKEALQRHDAQEARIIPVLLRPVEWYGLPFARIQAAPADAKPVTLWDDRDAAFVDITRRIRKSIAELQKSSEIRDNKEISMDNDEAQKLYPLTEQNGQGLLTSEALTNSAGWVEEDLTSSTQKSSLNKQLKYVQNNSGNAQSQQGDHNTMNNTSGITINDFLLLARELNRGNSERS